MTEIEEIRLDGVLPEVFVPDSGPAAFKASEVWLSRQVFRKGHAYSVAAASGTGKSSLCSYIYGLRVDYRGTIAFGPTDISTFGIGDWCALRRRHLAYLPQGLDLFPALSAIDNVLLKNRLTDFRTEVEIRDMFARLGLADRVDTPAGRLSAGQQQRVALIRALCQPFDFILLDEPVSHLDACNNRLCADIVAEAAAVRGAGIITTSVGNPLALPGRVQTVNL